MLPQAARSTEGPAEETCSARVSVRYCKSNESESRALFSLKYHRAFERFFAVLACWRDNSPSQAKVHKANQKIKEANVRTTYRSIEENSHHEMEYPPAFRLEDNA